MVTLPPSLRLWYTRIDEWHPLQAADERLRLDYINLLPPRLESTPRAFGPKFLSLKDTMAGVNRKLEQETAWIKGNYGNLKIGPWWYQWELIVFIIQ